MLYILEIYKELQNIAFYKNVFLGFIHFFIYFVYIHIYLSLYIKFVIHNN